MDYIYSSTTISTELQQNPNPNPIYDPYQATTNTPHVGGYFPNSDPYQQQQQQQQGYYPPHASWPPGVDPPYMPPLVTVTYAQQPIAYAPPQSVNTAPAPAPAPYQWDPAAIAQYGAALYAAGVSTPSPAIRSHRGNSKKKGPGPTKTKIVQSAWCEICRIDCNSKDVLDQHKLGKKHKKNIDKLRAPIAPTPTPVVPVHMSVSPAVVTASMPLSVSSSDPTGTPIIGPGENPDKAKLTNSQKARKKAAAARTENLDTKKRKVLEGGAAAEGVRMCTLCNVVCNSETVFNYHLAGQKHASMVKKQTFATGVAAIV